MNSLLRSLTLLLTLGLLAPLALAQQRLAEADGPLRVTNTLPSDEAQGLRPPLENGAVFDPMTGEPTTPAEVLRRFRERRELLRAAALPEANERRRTMRRAADRVVPAEAGRGGLVLTVDNAYDDADANPGDGFCATSFSDCTLRAAIEEANAASGPVTIEFGVFFGPTGSEIATGVWRIRPNISFSGSLGALPVVTRPDVTIDASTQPGAACGSLTTGSQHTIRVVLDGTLLLGAESGLVASGSASGFVARGLAVGNFPGAGIVFGETVANFGSQSVVECNYVGTDYTGSVDQGNTGGGIRVSGSSLFFLLGVTVRDNLVSGNGNQGLIVTRQRASILDNLIGPDASGLGRLVAPPFGGDNVSNAFGGIRIVSSGVRVEGNVISANGNAGPGIDLGAQGGIFGSVATGAVVVDNIIGLDRNSLGALNNGDFGVWLREGARDNDIGLDAPGTGNRVANSGGGARNGIVVSGTGTNDNRIRNNFVGFNAFNIAAPNANGIYVGEVFGDGSPARTLVGAPGAPNVASGNAFRGIYLIEDTDTVVEGNTVGLNPAGFALPNSAEGVNLDGSAAPIIRSNTVSGNGGSGVTLVDFFGASGPTAGAVIEGNRIGTNVSGTAARPNTLSGLAILDAVDTTVRDNVLSGNTDAGLYLEGTSEVVVDGNFIGTDTGAGIDLGNGLAGVFCHSADAVRIGAEIGVPFNTIAFNDGDGIFLRHTFSAGACQNVAVLTNRLFDNAGLGIDLAPNGVNPNDAGDFDAGANDGTNFPVITSATNDGAGSTVSFTLSAEANQDYRVQLYRSATPDPSGHGEGAAAVFVTTVTTSASGLASSTLNLGSSQFPAGVWVAGIATPIDGATFTGFRGTSEFGPAVQVQSVSGAPLTATITPTNPAPPVVLQRGDDVFFDVTFEVGANGPASFEFWTEAVLPNGNVRSPLIGPNTVNVSPPASVTLSFSQRVANVAPFGSYTYRVEAGTFPNTVLDSDSFAAEIVPGREAGPDDWQAFDASGQAVEAGTVYDFRTDATAVAASSAVPDAFALASAYPNPFRSSTTLALDVPEAGRVAVAVYDALGRRVAVLLDDEVTAATHRLSFDALSLPSGLYLIRATGAEATATQRVTLVR